MNNMSWGRGIGAKLSSADIASTEVDADSKSQSRASTAQVNGMARKIIHTHTMVPRRTTAELTTLAWRLTNRRDEEIRVVKRVQKILAQDENHKRRMRMHIETEKPQTPTTTHMRAALTQTEIAMRAKALLQSDIPLTPQQIRYLRSKLNFVSKQNSYLGRNVQNALLLR